MGKFFFFAFFFAILGSVFYGFTRKAQGRYSERRKEGLYSEMDIKSEDEIKEYRKQNSALNKIKEKASSMSNKQ